MNIDPTSDPDPSEENMPHSSDSSDGAFSSMEEDASFHTIFRNLDKVPAQKLTPDANFDASFDSAPFDDFELNVLAATAFSSVNPVELPTNFEQQVMDRINALQSVESEQPKSLKSSLVRQTSRELYSKYRTVVQIVFPLIVASGIILSMNFKDKDNVSNIATSSLIPDTHAAIPQLTMQVPTENPPIIKKESRPRGIHESRPKITKAVKPDGVITGLKP